MATVTVTPTVEPAAGSVPPRVRLNIADSGTPAVTAVTVTRLDPDGRLVPVRTFDGEPLSLSSATGLLYDYEAPFGAPVYYSTLESPTTVSAQVTVAVDEPWLIHPGVPVLSRPIKVAEFGSRTRRVNRGVFNVMGRDTAVVHTDGARKKPESVIVLNTITLADLTDLETLTDDASTLLLNIPAGLGWGIPTCYISVGDLEEARLLEYAVEQRRTWTLPYVVVRRPAGGSQATRTWTDVVIDNATWSDVMANYPSWLSLLAGP